MGADGGGGDFNEAQVKKMLDRSPYGVKFCRWVQIGGNCCGVRMNWVASLLATIITWGFALITIADVNNAPGYFSAGKLWVSTNFTWLYIRARACRSPALALAPTRATRLQQCLCS